MKGSKKFDKSIIAIVLSLILTVSAVAPLTAVGSEKIDAGSNGAGLGEYRYYSVKTGDTLIAIAQKNGITLNDILAYNNIQSDDIIYRGQVLKLPIVSSNESHQSIISSKITIKAKQASVKGLVSAIAYNAGYTVIFKGEDSKIDVELENVSPMKALDYVTRFAGLSYLKDGNTLLISTPEDLNSTFIDSLVLAKFSFKYITYSELLAQANALGITNIKTVSQANNQRDVWISAYPKEMAKIKELIDILDVPENISTGSNGIASAFTPIKLSYIDASEFSSLLGNLGLHTGITMPSYPNTLFVYVSGSQLNDILTIKKIVDTAEAVQDDKGNNTGNSGGSSNNGGTSDNSTNNSTDNSTNTNPGDTTGGTTGGTTTEATTFERIDLVNITRSDAEALIAKSGENITTYGHERMTRSLWLFGTASAIANAKAIISAVDGNVASAASTVHTYTAQNCTVDELMSRLTGVKYENVEFYQYDHSTITNSIIVYCDDVTWNNEIYDLLVALDTVDTGEQTWIPIDSWSDGADNTENVAILQDRFNLMLSLYPEVFSGVQVRYVETQSGSDTYKSITYVKVTSDQATRMMNLLEAFDNA